MNQKSPDTMEKNVSSVPFCGQEVLCTAGIDLVYTFNQQHEAIDPDRVAFSQYPRPADTPQVTT